MKKIAQKNVNRENLLNHGVALLMQQGYHGTGLQEILDAVQIPKGSFYNYFGSKEHFAAEIITHYISPYIEKLENDIHHSNGNTLNCLENYLNEAIVELEKTHFKGGCLIGNLIGEVSDTSELCRTVLQKAFNRYRDVWELGFIQAQHEGTLRKDKSAKEMADFWVNAWQGALLRMKIEQSTAPLKQCRDELLNNFFKAFYTQ